MAGSEWDGGLGTGGGEVGMLEIGGWGKETRGVEGEGRRWRFEGF